MPVSVALVEAEIRRRTDTDRKMAFGEYIIWMVVLSIVTLGIGAAIYAWAAQYRLVDRRSQHFARQQSLYRSVIRTVREHGEDNKNDKVLATVDRAEALLNEATIREPDRNPWLFAIILPIVTLGIGSWYTLWFLTVDWRRHSVRQRELGDVIGEALRQATGKSVALVDESIVPDRNFWLYLLLTFVTLGLFGLYWWYVIFEDPNKHFAQQAFVEDQMVSYLRALA